VQANDTECIGLVSIPPSQQGEFRNPKYRTQRRKRLKFNNLGPPRSPFFHHGGAKTSTLPSRTQWKLLYWKEAMLVEAMVTGPLQIFVRCRPGDSQLMNEWLGTIPKIVAYPSLVFWKKCAIWSLEILKKCAIRK